MVTLVVLQNFVKSGWTRIWDIERFLLWQVETGMHAENVSGSVPGMNRVVGSGHLGVLDLFQGNTGSGAAALGTAVW